MFGKHRSGTLMFMMILNVFQNHFGKADPLQIPFAHQLLVLVFTGTLCLRTKTLAPGLET